jgi:hypothetical protein
MYIEVMPHMCMEIQGVEMNLTGVVAGVRRQRLAFLFGPPEDRSRIQSLKCRVLNKR